MTKKIQVYIKLILTKILILDSTEPLLWRISLRLFCLYKHQKVWELIELPWVIESFLGNLGAELLRSFLNHFLHSIIA